MALTMQVRRARSAGLVSGLAILLGATALTAPGTARVPLDSGAPPASKKRAISSAISTGVPGVVGMAKRRLGIVGFSSVSSKHEIVTSSGSSKLGIVGFSSANARPVQAALYSAASFAAGT